MGKAYHVVKVSTGVCSPQRKLILDIVGLEKREQNSLWAIAKKASVNKQHRFGNLYGLLNHGMLSLAWSRLNKRAAIADRDMTVKRYAENLDDNLQNLVERLKNKKYKAKLVKRKYIEKENGKQRPLGIPALEDKIVQKAAAMILEAIYEQDFLDCSYAYRTNRGAKDAVGDLSFQLQYGKYGHLVEADVKGFFDNLDHEKLLEMLSLRINDKAFLRLIGKWLKAGILEPEGLVIHPDTGTPQGGIVSPVLANVYLHEVLDKWFLEQVKPRMKGWSFIYRYADDFLVGFQYREDAVKFYQVLPKRMGRYGLELEPSKTRIVRFSRFHPSMKNMVSFLGFEIYWFNDRSGVPRVKRRTARRKYHACVRRISDWIKEFRSMPKRKFFKALSAKLIGHYNYYYVFGNSQAVGNFYSKVVKLLYKWLNRRSQRKSLNWKQLNRLLVNVNLPRPKVTEIRRRHNVVFD